MERAAEGGGVTVDDLVRWLRTQLDADEETARAATPGPWWHNPGKQWLGPEAFEKYDLRQGEEFVGYGGPHPFTGAVCSTGPASDPQAMRDAAFIAAHDPARVLRDITARRRTLHQHKAATERMERAMQDKDPEAYRRASTMEVAFRAVIRNDAAVYRDRPGYREEWRP
jgi:hypothetical protein